MKILNHDSGTLVTQQVLWKNTITQNFREFNILNYNKDFWLIVFCQELKLLANKKNDSKKVEESDSSSSSGSDGEVNKFKVLLWEYIDHIDVAWLLHECTIT